MCSSIDLHITFTNVKTMKDHLKFGLDVETNETPPPTHTHISHPHQEVKKWFITFRIKGSEESRTSLSTSCELTFESKEQRVARDFTMEDKWGQSESSHMGLPAYMVLISLWC